MPGAGRLRARPVRRAGRRLRRHVQRLVFAAPCGDATRPDRGRRRVPGDAGQREGLHHHARGPPPEPARPGHQHPYRVLDLAGRGGAGFPRPAHRPVRHGAGRRCICHLPATQRLPVSGRLDAVARWAHAQLRCPRPRHGVQRRRGRGAAQTPVRRDGRWRHGVRGAARRRGEQRRRCQGQLYGARRGRSSGCHRCSAGVCRRRCAPDFVCRSARHRNADGRSDRSRGADAGLRTPHVRPGLLRPRLCQEQHRPHGDRCRGCRADQDRAGATHAAAAGVAALRGTQCLDRLHGHAVPCQRPVAALATQRHAASRRRQRLRGRWHQRACDRRGSPATGALGCLDRSATAGAVGPHTGRAHDSPGPAGRSPRSTS